MILSRDIRHALPENDRMPITRRAFLRNVAGLGLAFAGIEAGKKGWDLYEQHETWEEAARSNPEFFARHAAALDRLILGGSFAPEQWPLDAAGQQDAIEDLDVAVRDLGMKQLRIGLRWDRSVDATGNIDLAAYRPTLDYCFSHDVDVCLNVGPLRVFRFPEDHVPTSVLASLSPAPSSGDEIGLDHPLAHAGLDHLDGLLDALHREYGADLTSRVTSVQLENEPFYKIKPNKWHFTTEYMETVARRVDASFPNANLLITSAGRLNLRQIRDLYGGLLADDRFAGRLVSGFDFHYETPARDSYPVVRYFDQIAYGLPTSAGTDENIRYARQLGYRIEVTEGQAEPYGKFAQPGNSAKHFRFLVLRCLDKVLDPDEAALIRVWGVEQLVQKMMRGELTNEHRDMIEIIQRVNGARPGSDTQAGAPTR